MCYVWVQTASEECVSTLKQEARMETTEWIHSLV